MTIPKILHRAWLGSRQRPAAYDAYWDEWLRMNPGWQLMTWTEENIGSLDWPLHIRKVWDYLGQYGARGGIQMAAERALAVQRADILGYLILATHGGVYVNCDMEPIRPLDQLLDRMPEGVNAFAGHEDSHYLCNAVMGSTKSGRFMLAVLGELTPERLHANPQMEVATGPHLLTQVYYGRGGVGSDLWTLPREAFYYAHHGVIPYGSNASGFLDDARAAGAYALHHWGHRTQEGDV